MLDLELLLFVHKRFNSQPQTLKPDETGGIALLVDVVFFERGKAGLVERAIGFATDDLAVPL